MPTERQDHALIQLWVDAQGQNVPASGRESVDISPSVLDELAREGQIKYEGGTPVLTRHGEERARNMVRCHRLAERLLADVLGMDRLAIEDSACQFEHIISQAVADNICTLLGHPAECPHGLPIPQGPCCRARTRQAAPVVGRLSEIEIGRPARIAYIHTKSHPRLHKLLSFGIVPGAYVVVHQRFPTYVIQAGETTLALEKDLTDEIYAVLVDEQ